VGALKSRVRAILEEAGVAGLTMDALCVSLQDEYKINMKSHVGALKLIVFDVIKGFEFLVVPTSSGPVANREHADREHAETDVQINSFLRAKPQRALSPSSIFANEKRLAVVRAILARGGKISASRVRNRIADLWHVETDAPKYYYLAHKDQERYANEKAAFDWEETSTPKQLAACFEDAALQSPPARDEAPRDRASVAAAAASVYSYAVGYLQPFFVMVGRSWIDPKTARSQRTRWAALQLIAAGRGALRALASDHTLRVASGATATGQTLLRRAVLLRGLGELRELHEFRAVHDLRSPEDAINGTFIMATVTSLAQAAGCRSTCDGAASSDAPAAAALASLRVIKAENVTLPIALIEQCAATLTELECYRLAERVDHVLSRCTRLESLTLQSWWCCPPDAWLGLSQLHTLRGVSLCDVPPATIAAALPRLHTLHVRHEMFRHRLGGANFAVDAFYDELLPRLRSFHFLEGPWPEASDDGEVPMPLPLLEDFKWRAGEVNNLPHRRFMGARPSTLSICYRDLLEWLRGVDDALSHSPAATSPLTKVGALTVKLERTLPEKPFMARLLRAAPQLRQLTIDSEAVQWVLSGAFRPSGSLMPPFHLQLRHLAVTSEDSPLDVPVPRDCGVRLRQRHFPRLRRLTVGDRECSVWAPHQPASQCNTRNDENPFKERS
jgi:hypothetical protein